MLSLIDLLNSPEGLAFLRSEGVFADRTKFVDQLENPAQSRLADMLDVKDKKLVYTAQQIYIDYRQSVLSKLHNLQNLGQEKDLFTFLIWVDTDRSGSDKLTVRMVWPMHGQQHSVRISPAAFKMVEPRFTPIDTGVLKSAFDKLGVYLSQSGVKDKWKAKVKYDQLRPFFIEPNVRTLSEFNRRVTSFLLNKHLGLRLHSLILSNLINGGIITGEVELFLNHLDEIVEVFNEAVRDLRQSGIDPQVKPLDEHYLPLHFSCEADSSRLRLHHVMEGSDHFAVAACKCGRSYRFYLGEKRLSMDELAGTNRWSPDVCLGIFLNDCVSGFVAGKSSALYGIVMNRVLKVLDKKPVPILVPSSLGKRESGSNQLDSLIYEYLVGT